MKIIAELIIYYFCNTWNFLSFLFALVSYNYFREFCKYWIWKKVIYLFLKNIGFCRKMTYLFLKNIDNNSPLRFKKLLLFYVGIHRFFRFVKFLLWYRRDNKLFALDFFKIMYSRCDRGDRWRSTSGRRRACTEPLRQMDVNFNRSSNNT